MREMMDKHPGFRDTGKRMLNTWSEGVHRLRDRRMYALPVWPFAEAFAWISGPPKLESLVKVAGKSETKIWPQIFADEREVKAVISR